MAAVVRGLGRLTRGVVVRYVLSSAAVADLVRMRDRHLDLADAAERAGAEEYAALHQEAADDIAAVLWAWSARRVA